MRLHYQDCSKIMSPHAHGQARKDLVVLHETVSPDAPGFADINGVEKYLASKDYGIHGLTDSEGHIAWARGEGRSIFWHCGGVNERSIGIEQVSNVMLRSPSNAVRRKVWLLRQEQLKATAHLLAAIHNTWAIPLSFSDGKRPGVTSHWNVSQWSPASLGHTDCWPVRSGGYYPLDAVIELARMYALRGYTL